MLWGKSSLALGRASCPCPFSERAGSTTMRRSARERERKRFSVARGRGRLKHASRFLMASKREKKNRNSSLFSQTSPLPLRWTHLEPAKGRGRRGRHARKRPCAARRAGDRGGAAEEERRRGRGGSGHGIGRHFRQSSLSLAGSLALSVLLLLLRPAHAHEELPPSESTTCGGRVERPRESREKEERTKKR